MSNCKTIAICNQKGLMSCLGWQDADELPVTISDKLLSVIMDKNENPYDGILKHEEGVDLVPSNLELSSMEMSLVTAMCRDSDRNYVGKSRPESRAKTRERVLNGELLFNMLVLVGAVKMSDRIIREMMGL